MHLPSPSGNTNCPLQVRPNPDISLSRTSLGSRTNSRWLPTGSVCLQQGNPITTTSCHNSIPLDRVRTTLSDGCGSQQASSFFNNNFTHQTRPPLEAQLPMLCYTVLRITLQTSTKSKLRATHIHHRQVSNIIKDIKQYRQAHNT